MTQPWETEADEAWLPPWDEPGWPEEDAGPEYWLYVEAMKKEES